MYDIILVVVTNIIMVFNQHHLHHKVRFAWYPSYCIVIISAIIIEMISVIFSVIISVIIIGMISVIISVIISVVISVVISVIIIDMISVPTSVINSVIISVVISVIIIDMIMVPSDVSLLPRLRQVFCATMTAMEGSTDSAQPGSVGFLIKNDKSF